MYELLDGGRGEKNKLQSFFLPSVKMRYVHLVLKNIRLGKKLNYLSGLDSTKIIGKVLVETYIPL